MKVSLLIGIKLLIIAGVLMYFFSDRLNRNNFLGDFLLGVLFGLGFGLILGGIFGYRSRGKNAKLKEIKLKEIHKKEVDQLKNKGVELINNKKTSS